jgi:thioredoxin reductase (NADPH)
MVQIMDKRIREELYDIIILGGGVAGLAAGMTAGRLGLRVLVLEKEVFGGSVAVLETVSEYPGIEKVGGWELTQTMARQAEDAGCVLIDSIDAVDLMEFEGGTFGIKSRGAYQFRGRSVIITTGGQPRPLGLEKEKFFAQRGIHTCAQCAGPRYKDKEIAIAGNGSWAVEAALHLLSLGCRVSFITGDAKMTGNVFLIDKLMRHEGFQFMAGWHIEKLYGSEHLEEVDLIDLRSGKTMRIKVAAVFVYRSIVPNINIISARQNAKGFLVLDENYMTSLPGVFAAGRVADYEMPIQVIAGDGSRAALSAAAWLQADT